MTVSYKKSKYRANAGEYYIACQEKSDGIRYGSKSVDDDYSGSAKEPPGVWYAGPDTHSNRTEAFGFTHGLAFSVNNLDSERFLNMVKGFSLKMDIKWTQNSGSLDRLALHDWTLSAPKSVSVAWGLGDSTTKLSLEKSQEKNSRIFLDFMSRFSIVRRGAQGAKKLQAPLLGATFGHGSSRANDPQLHTHCVIFNLSYSGTDTNALETMVMMKWIGAAASLYHAGLAWDAATMGFGITRKNNLFELNGIPMAVCSTFSKRRHDIEKTAREKFFESGLDPDAASVSRGIYQQAAIETRNKKSELNRDQLQQRWNKEGLDLGFTAADVLIAMNEVPFSEIDSSTLNKVAYKALREITAHHAIFKEPALLTKAATTLFGMASPARILQVVEHLKESLLLQTFSIDERTGLQEQIFTTREMATLEREMLGLVHRMNGQHVLADYDLSEKLNPVQREAALTIFSDSNAVSVLDGRKAADRRNTMTSITRAFELKGYKVTTVMGRWNAALNLASEARLADGPAISKWFNDLLNNTVVLNGKDLIVVEEAGMVGVHVMRDILQAAYRAQAKVILSGDTMQQKAIASGAALRVIQRHFGSARVDEFVQQSASEDRVAVQKFFQGKAMDALANYINKGQVHIAQTDIETNNMLLQNWNQSRLENPNQQSLMIAVDRKSVRELNRLAHQILKGTGKLGASQEFKTTYSTPEYPKIEFSVGDDVFILLATSQIKASTRALGTIESFDGDIINMRVNSELISIDTNDEHHQYKRSGKPAGLSLSHAYCASNIAYQSLCVDHAFVKDSVALDRISIGHIASHHRLSCRFYIDRSARYRSKIKTCAPHEFHTIDAYSDDALLANVATSWSKNSNRYSTLDYDNWNQSGKQIDLNIERQIDSVAQLEIRSDDTMETANNEARFEKSQVLDKSENDQSDLIPQIASTNTEEDDQNLSLENVERIYSALLEIGIDDNTAHHAIACGFLQMDKEGEILFCGRSAEGKLVNLVKNQPINTDEQVDSSNYVSAYPENYTPILWGNPEHVVIAKTGIDALRIFSTAQLLEESTPTIIVSGGLDKPLSHSHTLDLISKAHRVTREDGVASNIPGNSKAFEQGNGSEFIAQAHAAASYKAHAHNEEIDKHYESQNTSRG
jgi:conjugative relaxase-like TrwC/TraI family protein